MASVKVVYDALKSLTNKEQRGFVTPSIFNSFTASAQMNVFNNILGAQMTAGAIARSKQVTGDRDVNPIKYNREDLSMLIKETTISQTVSTQDYAKPSDFARLISLKTFGSFVLDQTTSIPVDVIYDSAKIDYILASTLSSPKESTPIATLTDTITVYPTSIKKIKLRYYKIPQSLTNAGVRSTSSPTYGYITTGGNVEIFNPTTSTDFELPDQYTSSLILEIGKMIGVNLRDSDVYAYTNNQSSTNQ